MASHRRRVRGGGDRPPPPPPTHAPREVVDEAGLPYVVSRSSAAAPSWDASLETSLKVLRLSAGVWMSIADCDETFNYWEPAHFLLFGRGFQTWEYSPAFALRSYLYVLAHAVPGWAFAGVARVHRMYVFYFVRCLLAVACAYAEIYLAKGIRKEIGANAARLTLLASLLSCGMFHASPAFLPSSTSMMLTALAFGAWFRHQFALATFFVAISALLSWPFAALVGVPIALDILRRGLLLPFAKWCLVSAAAVLLPMAAVDSQYYGRTVLTSANIVLYNVFTDHGPDLYGVEDAKFYFVNAFLNFNILFPLALAAGPLVMITPAVIPTKKHPGDIPRWMLHLAMYLWLAVFTAQSHKEERFLFPIYPLIPFAAAMSMDCLQKLFFRFFVRLKNRHYLDHTFWLSSGTLILHWLLSTSRVASLHLNYGGATNTWIHLSHLPLAEDFVLPATGEAGVVNVCVGKEWHRFPNSFFLPADNWELKFLRSEFRGQLPQPYLQDENATTIVRETFNDLNKEEENRYEVTAEECHYLVDLDTGRHTELEPIYAVDTGRWEVIASSPFLDAASSGCSGVLRAFYVPVLTTQECIYSEYQLLRNKQPVVHKRTKNDAKRKSDLKRKIRHL